MNHAVPPILQFGTSRFLQAIYPCESEPLQPAGALAEPCALWAAVEWQTDLVLPCTHDAIVLTDRAARSAPVPKSASP